jgi:hypothetical protein
VSRRRARLVSVERASVAGADTDEDERAE